MKHLKYETVKENNRHIEDDETITEGKKKCTFMLVFVIKISQLGVIWIRKTTDSKENITKEGKTKKK